MFALNFQDRIKPRLHFIILIKNFFLEKLFNDGLNINLLSTHGIPNDILPTVTQNFYVKINNCFVVVFYD